MHHFDIGANRDVSWECVVYVRGVSRMTEVTIREQMMRMTSRAMAIPFQFLCGGALPTRSWKTEKKHEMNARTEYAALSCFYNRAISLFRLDDPTVLQQNCDLKVMSFVLQWRHSISEIIWSYIEQMYVVLPQLESEVGPRTTHSLTDRCPKLSHLSAVTKHLPAAPRCPLAKSSCSSAW